VEGYVPCWVFEGVRQGEENEEAGLVSRDTNQDTHAQSVPI
jgi:hypothetical protein